MTETMNPVTAETALPQVATLAQDELETPPLTLSQLTWRRFRRHKMAVSGGVVLILLFLYAFGGSLFASEKYANYNDTSLSMQSPSVVHPFGTDAIGRDIMARTIYGGQISLIIGLFAVMIETFFGILVGALAGYYGGVLDSILMRITEAMLNIPEIFLLIVMAKFFSGRIPDLAIMGADVQRQRDRYCGNHWGHFLDVSGAYCQG